MNNLVIICGPAATGKTTVVEKLLNKYNGFYMRPCDSYFKLGKERNIPKNQVFSKISDEEAGKEYCKICKEHELIICDQHMAIQFLKDSKIASGDFSDLIDTEEYTESISKEFIQPLLNSDIKIFMICLYADPKVLESRALYRNKKTNFIVRNTSLDMVKKELKNEMFYYKQFLSNYSIEGTYVDTTSLTEDEVLENVIQEIDRFRGKREITFKWSK